MKPINLYDIYRKVSARNRAPKSVDTKHKAEAMRAAADRIVDAPTLMQVKAFRSAENLWLASHDVAVSAKSMADQFEEAIRSKCFVSKRSYFDPRGTNGTKRSGLIYCASSVSRPSQFKLGFTTMGLKARFQKMSTRHGIVEPCPLFAISVSYPAKIEAQTKKKLRDYLVAGCTKGNSNEWYRVKAIEFARSVVAIIEESGTSVAEVTLFADCPNAKNVKTALNQLGVGVNSEIWQ